VKESREWSLVPLAALDEPAHLLTAWLVLAAATARTARLPLLPWVLTGAVLLDLDHVPLYLGADIAVSPGGRPVSHSLLTVALLLVAAGAVRRWRVPLAGLALGVATQLLRDLATGPGVPLLWPVLAQDVLLPYPPYGVVLVALAAAGVARRVSGRAAGAPATA
jgi:inner membrane protein